MSVDAITSSASIYTNQTSRSNSSASVATPNDATSPSSTVTISEAARQAAAADVNANRPDPVENYRLPNWTLPLFPPTTVKYNMDGVIEETRAYDAFTEKLAADGDFSDADRAKAQAYFDNNMPLNAAWRANDAFNQAHSSELAEYDRYFNEAWFSSLREEGVESHWDYVDKVLNAPDDSLALRDRVVSKLLANPRAVELMGMLGIERPESA